MKKLFTLLLMLVSFCAFSQNENENLDSINTALINSAGKNLERFEKQNIAGYFLMIGGTILTTIAAGQKNTNPYTTPANSQANISKNRGFTIAGIVLSAFGGLMILSSSSNVSAAGRKLRKVKAKK